jgi:hypothetical protein
VFDLLRTQAMFPVLPPIAEKSSHQKEYDDFDGIESFLRHITRQGYKNLFNRKS